MCKARVPSQLQAPVSMSGLQTAVRAKLLITAKTSRPHVVLLTPEADLRPRTQEKNISLSMGSIIAKGSVADDQPSSSAVFKVRVMGWQMTGQLNYAGVVHWPASGKTV